MKILVTGAGGQLAHDILTAANERLHDVVPLPRADLDIGDAGRIDAALADHQPDVLINCAAYNLVDKAEEEPVAAFAVNAFGPRNLARACAKAGCDLAHFSTDYVFGLDADRRTPWREDDAPGPVSVYGASKLAGEYFVRAECPRHFVLRTCGLYGRKGARGKGGNFVETMLRLAREGKPIRVVADQWCTPSYTADIARTTIELVESNQFGLYHVTNAGGPSWFEFAAEIFRISRLTVDLHPIKTADWRSAARRPLYSVLDLGKLSSAGVASPPTWQDALARYIASRP